MLLVKKLILYAEDSADDALLAQLAFDRVDFPAELRVVDDGHAAIRWLNGEENYSDRKQFPVPDLVITDLKMHRTNGFDLLQWIRGNVKFKELPVVIHSSSGLHTDREKSTRLGATAFVVKNYPLDSLLEAIRPLLFAV
jgi:CheY-like chemotaxis protein